MAYPKFLKVLGGPMEEFVCGYTLRSAIRFMATVDFVLAAFAAINLIVILTGGSIRWNEYFSILFSLFWIYEGLAAYVGLVGIEESKPPILKHYFIAKLLSIPVTVLSLIVEALSSHSLVSPLTIGVLEFAFYLFCFKALASGYYRLLHNEEILVFYGKKIMKIYRESEHDFDLQ